MFQSSPPRVGGCDGEEPVHGERHVGVSILTPPGGGVRHGRLRCPDLDKERRFNPHPPGWGGATVAHRLLEQVGQGFNPHPPGWGGATA